MIRKFWKSRVFRIWMTGYLIVILIPLIFIVVQHAENMKESREYAYTRGKGSVNQLAVSIDEQIRNVFTITDAIAASSNIRKLRYCDLPLNAEKYYEIHQRISVLSEFSAQSDLINGLYLYSSGLNCLLDYGRIYTRENRYEYMVEHVLGVQINTFERLMDEKHLHDLYLPGDGRKMLLLKTVSTGTGSDSPCLTLIALIDTSSLKKMILKITDSWEGDFRILLPDKALLSTQRQMEKDQMLNVFSHLDKMRRQGGTVLSVQESDVTSATYVLSAPESVFFVRLASDRIVFLMYFVVILVTMVVISFLLARHNYEPVQKLKETAEIMNGGQDEFSQIAQRFREMRTNADRMMEKIRLLEDIENDRLFDALLEGDPDRIKGQTAGEITALFDRHYLITLVMDMDRDDGSSYTRAQLADLLREDLHRKCADIAQAYVKIHQSDIVCILCFPDTSNTYDIQLFTKQMVKEIISDSHLSPVSVYIGDAHEGTPGISLSFYEALQAREYARFVAETEKQVVVYDKTMYSTGTTWDSYDIVAAEKNLISLLLNDDYDRCEQLVGEIMTYYTAHEGVSLYVMRYRMFSIMNMMMNVLREIRTGNEPQNPVDERVIRQLMSVRTMQELEDAVQKILSELRNSRVRELNQQVQKLDKVEQYIDLHYQDPNLSVQQVATAFGMSLPYLSREFKNSRGIGVLTYINRYRIEKAKEMLRMNRSMTVAEIAEAVGYNSSQTLIRIFKRYEDNTPGQFRLTEDTPFPTEPVAESRAPCSSGEHLDMIHEEGI